MHTLKQNADGNKLLPLYVTQSFTNLFHKLERSEKQTEHLFPSRLVYFTNAGGRDICLTLPPLPILYGMIKVMIRAQLDRH